MKTILKPELERDREALWARILASPFRIVPVHLCSYIHHSSYMLIYRGQQLRPRFVKTRCSVNEIKQAAIEVRAAFVHSTASQRQDGKRSSVARALLGQHRP